MKLVICVAVIIAIANVRAYHDPDLNYHLSQLQKQGNCDKGYSYPAPTVQLSTSGLKVAVAPAQLVQHVAAAPAYSYQPVQYQPAPSLQYLPQPAQQIAYTAQPAATYQTSLVSQGSTNYASKEFHGYATSAGLSAVASSGKTVTPLATYAQAPIISKVTAAPLIAKYALAPPKITYSSQNLVSQQAYSGSAAKASLNSYSSYHHGGPVVSQVIAAPSVRYATSPALKVQQVQAAQVVAPERYTAIGASAPIVSQYNQITPVAPIASGYRAPVAAQYSQVSHVSHPTIQYSQAPVAQYSALPQHSFVPAVTQHFTPAVQYAAPIKQYAAPVVTQYASSDVSHYSSHGSAGSLVHQSAPVAQYAAPVVAQYAAPAVTKIATAPVAVKTHTHNAHEEFVANYDSHPRYAYEYSVNDPHTGDIKQQKEERDGEVVKGQYSLVEPDGSVRTVEYVADWETGFHANVRNSKDNQH